MACRTKEPVEIGGHNHEFQDIEHRPTCCCGKSLIHSVCACGNGV